MSPQELDRNNGIVRIQVIEGSLESVDIQGIKRLGPNYILRRLEPGITAPLNLEQLEATLQLIRTNPSIETITATIQPGKGLGKSILVVEVEEANPIQLGLSANNYTTPNTGSEQTGASLNLLNFSGIGDSLVLSANRSTNGGSTVFDFSYTLPLNPQEGTLQLRAIREDNRITAEPFASFNIEGESELYQINWRQPLIRSLKEEFALSVGFRFQDNENFFRNNNISLGETRTSSFQFAQDYLKRDKKGLWGLRSQFNFGVDLFDSTVKENSDPDSRFFSWQGQARRLQRLGEDNILIVAAEVQLTPDSLLSSEQFVIGGGQSLRGYRQNVRSGDNGFRISLEDRIILERDEEDNPQFQLAPFVDLGKVWNDSDNPKELEDETFLIGVGLGVILEPVEGLNIRIDYAAPLVDLDDKGNNAQDDGFYFSVDYRI